MYVWNLPAVLKRNCCFIWPPSRPLSPGPLVVGLPGRLFGRLLDRPHLFCARELSCPRESVPVYPFDEPLYRPSLLHGRASGPLARSRSGSAATVRKLVSGKLKPADLSPLWPLSAASIRSRRPSSRTSGTHLSLQTLRAASFKSVTLTVWTPLPPAVSMNCLFHIQKSPRYSPCHESAAYLLSASGVYPFLIIDPAFKPIFLKAGGGARRAPPPPPPVLFLFFL